MAKDKKDGEKELSGSEAIRKALEAGVDKPAEIVPWVKEKFGIDVTKGLIGQVKNKAGGKAGGKEKGKKGKRAGKDISDLGLMASIAPLVEAHGIEKCELAFAIVKQIKG